jgi:hypothetical protein
MLTLDQANSIGPATFHLAGCKLAGVVGAGAWICEVTDRRPDWLEFGNPNAPVDETGPLRRYE